MRIAWSIYRFFFYLWIVILAALAVGAIRERLVTDMSMAWFNVMFDAVAVGGIGFFFVIGISIAIIGRWVW